MKRRLILASLIVGFSSILTQIIVLREAIAGFYSNELTLGIILGNWLLLSALGAYLGKYSKKFNLKKLIYSLTLISIISPLTIFLIKTTRNFVLIPGQLLSLNSVLLYSFVILLPFCLISGFQFTLIAIIYSKRRNVNDIYITDSIGDLLAGFGFSYFLVFILNSFQAIYILIFLNLVSAFILSRRKRWRFAIVLLAFLFIIFLLSFNLQELSTKSQYPNQKVVLEKNSIYGNVVVTKLEDQLNFYENGFPLFNTNNIFSNEETTHYALLQHPLPKNILLISGGISGTLNEVLKYPLDRVDYLELDPLILEIGKEFIPSDTEKIKTINTDARFYVKNTKERYDIVIIDLPNPESIQINRFYTLEFFRELKGVLKENGIVSLKLQGSENVLTQQLKNLNSVIYNTLKLVFRNVIIIPGSTNYFVSSDSNLDYNYEEKLKEKGIETKFIEPYLESKITKDRLDYIQESVKESDGVNKDLKPTSHYLYISYWLNLFKSNYVSLMLLIFLILILTLYLSKLRPVPFGIFITGFSGLSLEFIIIVAFQIFYGFIYHKIGIIITAFLLGSILGALITKNKKEVTQKSLAGVDFLLVLYSVLLLFFILVLTKINLANLDFLFTFLTILLGFLVGMEFPIAVNLTLEKSEVSSTIALIYSSDLIGACMGAYIISIFLVPKLGVISTLILIAVLNLISGLYLLITSKHH